MTSTAPTAAAKLVVIDIALRRYRDRYLACLDAGHFVEADWWEEQIDKALDDRLRITGAT